MPTLIADWSKYQSRFIGDPNIFADKYNPAKWVVDVNFDDVAAADVQPE